MSTYSPTRYPRRGVIYGGIHHEFGSGPGQSGGLENAGFAVTYGAGVTHASTYGTETIVMDNSGGVTDMVVTATMGLNGFTGAGPASFNVNIYQREFGSDGAGSYYQVKLDPQDGTNEYSLKLTQTAGHLLTDIIHGTTIVAQGDATAQEPRRTIIATGDRQELLTAGGFQSLSGYEAESTIGSWNCGSAGAVGVIVRLYGAATGPLSQARKTSYKSTGGALAESSNYVLTLTFSVPAGKSQTYDLLSMWAIWDPARFTEQHSALTIAKRFDC